MRIVSTNILYTSFDRQCTNMVACLFVSRCTHGGVQIEKSAIIKYRVDMREVFFFSRGASNRRIRSDCPLRYFYGCVINTRSYRGGKLPVMRLLISDHRKTATLLYLGLRVRASQKQNITYTARGTVQKTCGSTSHSLTAANMRAYNARSWLGRAEQPTIQRLTTLNWAFNFRPKHISIIDLRVCGGNRTEREH